MCGEAVWRLPGGCEEAFGWVSIGCLKGMGRLSGGCEEAVWWAVGRLSGGMWKTF